MTLACFYVLISRVRTFEGLRLLQNDHAGLVAVSSLKHDEMLYAWEHGYDGGTWSDERAVAALKHMREVRQQAKQAAAAKKNAAKKAAEAKKKDIREALRRRRPPMPTSRGPRESARPEAARVASARCRWRSLLPTTRLAARMTAAWK